MSNGTKKKTSHSKPEQKLTPCKRNHSDSEKSEYDGDELSVHEILEILIEANDTKTRNFASSLETLIGEFEAIVDQQRNINELMMGVIAKQSQH